MQETNYIEFKSNRKWEVLMVNVKGKDFPDGVPLPVPGPNTVFTILCGYGDIYGVDPIIPNPRGLPEDVSDSIKEHYEGDADNWNASWFLPEEILTLNFLPLISEGLYKSLKNLVEKFGEGNCRIVFWFDDKP